MSRASILVVLMALATPAASAADFAVETARVAVAPGLWRGHFSGGLNYDPPAQNIALAWNDQVSFFPDDVSCRRWIRDLRRQFRTYQGFSGCLRIR